MTRFHLAQFNIARTFATSVEDPVLADFVARLDDVNALAEASPGFVWRLQDESGNATSIDAFDDPRMIVNLSVWASLEAYMMSPGGVALPQVDQPVAWSLPAMLNPSFPFLLAHRTFGNFSYVMLLTGGVFALRYMSQRRKNPTSEECRLFRLGVQHMFHDWVSLP